MTRKREKSPPRKRFVWKCEEVRTKKKIISPKKKEEIELEIAELLWECLNTSTSQSLNQISENNHEEVRVA